MKRLVILTYFVVLTAVFAVAQTYGTHHTGPQYDPRYTEGFQTTDYNKLSPVGATAVPSMATTTYDEVIDVNPAGPLRSFDTGAESGQSGESPIGEPMILLLFAMLFAGGIAIKNKRMIQS